MYQYCVFVKMPGICICLMIFVFSASEAQRKQLATKSGKNGCYRVLTCQKWYGRAEHLNYGRNLAASVSCLHRHGQQQYIWRQNI